jgi:hypothetical protein
LQGQKKVSKESKEFEMSRSHLFNVLIAAALLTVVALTLWQSIETTKVVSAAEIEKSASYRYSACFSGMDRFSLTSVYVKEARAWIPVTNKGATGVDGGLMSLLSNYRSCSR